MHSHAAAFNNVFVAILCLSKMFEADQRDEPGQSISCSPKQDQEEQVLERLQPETACSALFWHKWPHYGGMFQVRNSTYKKTDSQEERLIHARKVIRSHQKYRSLYQIGLSSNRVPLRT